MGLNNKTKNSSSIIPPSTAIMKRRITFVPWLHINFFRSLHLHNSEQGETRISANVVIMLSGTTVKRHITSPCAPNKE